MILYLNDELIATIDRFRLLNSEIGNDQDIGIYRRKIKKGFRLLNSEIGNDQVLTVNE